MKTLLMLFILYSNVSFAQNGAFNMGEMPIFCKPEQFEKQKCEVWLSSRMKQVTNSPEYKKHQEVEKLEQAKKHKQQEEDLKKSKCDDPYFTEEEQYFCRMKMYENVSSEDRLADCVMSMDSREITCGDRIYTLSGQVSNGSRLNNKANLPDNTRVHKPLIPGSKVNKQ